MAAQQSTSGASRDRNGPEEAVGGDARPRRGAAPFLTKAQFDELPVWLQHSVASDFDLLVKDIDAAKRTNRVITRERGPGGKTAIALAILGWSFQPDGKGTTPDIRSTVTTVRMLARAGWDVNAPDNAGFTPLMLASGAVACLDLVKALLDLGADVHARNLHQATALHSAAFRQSRPVAKVLIAAGADMFARDREGYVPVEVCQSETMRTWLEGLMTKKLELFNQRTLRFRKPYTAPAPGDDLEELLWKQAGHSFEERFCGFFARFVIDFYKQRFPWTEPDTTLDTDCAAATPMAADSAGNPGRRVTLTWRLHDCSRRGDAAGCGALLETRPDIVSMSLPPPSAYVAGQPVPVLGAGVSALHWAAMNDHVVVARMLVNAGANIVAVDAFGSTPLHFAVELGRTKVVEYLVGQRSRDARASVDVLGQQDSCGNTPLHAAAAHGKPSLALVQMLVAAGARCDVRNRDGHRPHEVTRSKKVRSFLLQSLKQQIEREKQGRVACSGGSSGDVAAQAVPSSTLAASGAGAGAGAGSGAGASAGAGAGADTGAGSDPGATTGADSGATAAPPAVGDTALPAVNPPAPPPAAPVVYGPAPVTPPPAPQRELITIPLEAPLPEAPEAMQGAKRFLLKAELPPCPNLDFGLHLYDAERVISQRLLPTTPPDRSLYDRLREKVVNAQGGNTLRACFFARLSTDRGSVSLDIAKSWQMPW